MKKATLLMAVAALSFMLTACGDKKANQAQDADNETDATVEEGTETLSEDNADGDDSPALKTGEIADIRRVWASRPITPVAADKEADIEYFAFAFCMEYPDYEPNKALYDYLEFPTRYANQNFHIDNQKKNGYIKCMGMYQVNWDTSACYWKRNNGHSLVAFWMEQGHESGDPALSDALIVFYDYDPATDTMTPEPSLGKKIETDMASYDEYSVRLPEEGKDIELIGQKIDFENDSCDNTYYLLRWNGNDFNLEKVESEE